ncbi:hypothetical protein KP509_28G069600 [Ceratopteris richardii]|nr:hypothetical protein KP509_28G069600 [Ceratopteris richardii]
MVYSIFELVSMAKRLLTGGLMFRGRISSYISYIGDQICIVLLMSGGSAGAALLRELDGLTPGDIAFCDATGNFCSQTAAGVAMIFLGIFFLICSYVISAICFHQKKV